MQVVMPALWGLVAEGPVTEGPLPGRWGAAPVLQQRCYEPFCLTPPLRELARQNDVVSAGGVELLTETPRVLRAPILQHTKAVGNPRHIIVEQQHEIVVARARRRGEPLGPRADDQVTPRCGR